MKTAFHFNDNFILLLIERPRGKFAFELTLYRQFEISCANIVLLLVMGWITNIGNTRLKTCSPYHQSRFISQFSCQLPSSPSNSSCFASWSYCSVIVIWTDSSMVYLILEYKSFQVSRISLAKLQNRKIILKNKTILARFPLPTSVSMG